MANPLSIRDRNNFGELQFPKLTQVTGVATSSLSDMRSSNVTKGTTWTQRQKQLVSNANKKLDERLGATSEFRRIRYNKSYKPILDTLGEDFPFHPEYIFVMNIICKYYGVHLIDIVEFSRAKQQLHETENYWSVTSMVHKRFNVETSTCFNTMMYFLFHQYKCNPLVIINSFGTSQETLYYAVKQFAKTLSNSANVKADYATLIGRLLELEGIISSY